MARRVEPWMCELTIDDIPEAWRQVAEAIGVESFLRLAATVGGCSFYVPKLERLTSPVRDERIRAEFDGGNHRQLAIRYNLSEQRIRDILAAREAANQPRFEF